MKLGYNKQSVYMLVKFEPPQQWYSCHANQAAYCDSGPHQPIHWAGVCGGQPAKITICAEPPLIKAKSVKFIVCIFC